MAEEEMWRTEQYRILEMLDLLWQWDIDLHAQLSGEKMWVSTHQTIPTNNISGINNEQEKAKNEWTKKRKSLHLCNAPNKLKLGTVTGGAEKGDHYPRQNLWYEESGRSKAIEMIQPVIHWVKSDPTNSCKVTRKAQRKLRTTRTTGGKWLLKTQACRCSSSKDSVLSAQDLTLRWRTWKGYRE